MIAEVLCLLEWLRRDFLRQAFTRYDVDRSGRLDGKDRFCSNNWGEEKGQMLEEKLAGSRQGCGTIDERVRWWWSVLV